MYNTRTRWTLSISPSSLQAVDGRSKMRYITKNK